MKSLLLVAAMTACLFAQETKPENPLTEAQIQAAASLIGLSFTAQEIELMRDDLFEQQQTYAQMRKIPLGNEVPPALYFDPFAQATMPVLAETKPRFAEPGPVSLPVDEEDLAFMTVGQLSALIHARKLTSVALTKLYLERLKTYGPKLECVISLLEERALAQAAERDAELAAGHWRGPLHGIPFGAKDLFAVRGTRTTWGATPYKDQIIDDTATVVARCEAAGAVLVAKLTLGALAWGEVWYGGMTRNPWNLEQGSSGSSAGSAAATAAGLVAFSLGTETYGSIVSPSTRCGVTGLRPSFGRVSRAGAMALTWSMDKVGPICRSVDDCALVFDVIRGRDGRDATVRDAPFPYDATKPLNGLRVGYLAAAFEEEHDGKAADQAVLERLRSLGLELAPIALPELPVDGMNLIISVEGAAAFDELTRSNRDDQLVRQIRYAWPNFFRKARLVPAVEYLQANRLRSQLMAAMERTFSAFDVIVTPSFGGNSLLATNLTGHPCVVLPDGFAAANEPASICFLGRLFGEADLLRVALAYQNATDHHRQRPQAYKQEKAAP